MATFPTATNRKKKPLEYHFVDMNDPDRYKKLKVGRACDFCRRRKSKCDVGIPGSGTCSNCQKHQMACVFSPVSSVKWNRGSHHPAHPDGLDRAMDPSKSNPIAVTLTTTHSHTVDAHISHSPYLAFPQLYVDSCGGLGYESVSHDADTSPHASWMPLTDVDWRADSADPQPPWVPEPSSQLENMLFETYFEHVHPFFPILHKQTILDRLQQDRRLLPVSLRCAIIAIACHFSSSAVQELLATSSPANAFYLRARYHFDHLSAPNLATAQILLLLYKYQELCVGPFGAVNTLGVSHLERAHAVLDHLQIHGVQTHHDELRTRAQWTIYMIVSLSNPHHDDIRRLRTTLAPPVSLPSILDDEFQDADELHTLSDFVKLVHVVMRYTHITARPSNEEIEPGHLEHLRHHHKPHAAYEQAHQWATKSLGHNDRCKTGAVRAAILCMLYDMADLLLLLLSDPDNDMLPTTAARLQHFVSIVEQHDMLACAIQGRRIAVVALFLVVQAHVSRFATHHAIRADEGGTSEAACFAALELLEKLASAAGDTRVVAALCNFNDALVAPSSLLLATRAEDHSLFFPWPSTPSLVPEVLPEMEWTLADEGPMESSYCRPVSHAMFEELYVDHHENPITPTHPLGPDPMPAVYETDYFQAWTMTPIDDDPDSPPPSFQASQDCAAAIPSQLKNRTIGNLHLPS